LWIKKGKKSPEDIITRKEISRKKPQAPARTGPGKDEHGEQGVHRERRRISWGEGFTGREEWRSVKTLIWR
jgi:hypothetical protein